MKTKRRLAVEYYQGKLRSYPTVAEILLRKELNKHQIPHIFQKTFLLSRRRNLIVDFYFRKAKLIVEIDGGYHRQTIAKDRSRDASLRHRGFRVLRFWNSEVEANMESVITKIKEKIAKPFTQREARIFGIGTPNV